MLVLLGSCFCGSPVRNLQIQVNHNTPLDYAADWCTAPEWMPNTCCGPLQSPIDIYSRDVTQTRGEPLGVKTMVVPETRMVLTSNGVELELEGAWLEFDFNGLHYTAEQLHYHSPSEHAFNGLHCAGEMHIVANDKSGDKHAVLGFCLQMSVPSNVNALFAQFETILNANKESDIVPGFVSEPQYDMSAESLQPIMDGSFIQYLGSYTTPGCNLDVEWMIFTTPVPVAISMIEYMQRLFKQPANHRPLQALDLPNRQLKLVEVCKCNELIAPTSQLISSSLASQCDCSDSGSDSGSDSESDTNADDDDNTNVEGP